MSGDARNLKIIVQYDGTLFDGFQRQPGRRTVQGELEAALTNALGEPVKIVGAGRTDAGVHARGQAANFLAARSAVPSEKIPHAVLPFLPEDLGVSRCDEVPPDFNARLSARGKEYRYRVYEAERTVPDLRRHALRAPPGLDWGAVERACPRFLGERDFSAFGNAGSDLGNPVKRIERAEVVDWEEGRAFVFQGSGFLYRMVRNMTGMLLEIGKGRRAAEDIDRLLAPGAVKSPSDYPTAPPHGLYLMKVFY